MSAFRLKTSECRIGVVGLYNAGKTVLLTSLINHLENHDPDRFPIGKTHASIRKFTAIPLEPGWAPFPYAAFRDALVHGGKWPEKTRDRSAYACRFERSDWKFHDCELKLYDLPGERLADAAMRGRSFAEWSDAVLARIESDTPYRTTCGPYLELLKAGALDEAKLLGAYKLALAKLILAFKPMISPSAFLLDPQGSVARPSAPEELAAVRFTGLDAKSEFAPLSAEARTKNPILAALFHTRYERYKEELVEPFLKALKSCTSLIVLVDVLMLLAGGVGMYDDNRQILKDLFDVLDPGESTGKAVGRHLANVFLPHGLRPRWINRVAFVAPKLDLVHPLDRDRTLTLLKRMIGKLAENRDGLTYRHFNCAAVASTRVLPGTEGERWLVGRPYRDANGKKLPPGEEQRFAVSTLPDDWPADWQPGQFQYPEVYPAVPTRKDCPPEQINLSAVFDFAMG